ncbi:hypothetical protein LTR56_021989 [Elasticomyces elasticus]|nr:hypothetical protein LTR56_021989 [Elasticomyces elasticus]KAK3630223.1 hypothetical protein LTR22_021601 [Elasticomyces elasticus]KAK4920151.1 hypothetical protein LTR49_012250 [Elasticomyces elasticus]KAK5748954.1 hypothetical protein LTS12_020991 [Elasticomyces elasticus]
MDFKSGQHQQPEFEHVFVTFDDPCRLNRQQKQLVNSRAAKMGHLRRHPVQMQETKEPTRKSRDSRTKAPKTLQPVSQSTESNGSTNGVYRLAETVGPMESLPRLSSRARIGRSSRDPFDTSPVQSESWHDWVMDYYMHDHLPLGIALLEQSRKEGQDFINHHMRQSMTEPCMYYMLLLNACTVLVAEGRMPLSVAASLRSRVVTTVREAISDTRRAMTTAVILTVASIAIHEHLYGDTYIASNVHARACERMIAMQGGLLALKLPRIEVEILRWSGAMVGANYAGQLAPNPISMWASAETRMRHPGYEATTSMVH